MLYLYIVTAILAILIVCLVVKLGDVRIELEALKEAIRKEEIENNVQDSYLATLENKINNCVKSETLEAILKTQEIINKIGGTD